MWGKVWREGLEGEWRVEAGCITPTSPPPPVRQAGSHALYPIPCQAGRLCARCGVPQPHGSSSAF